MDILTELWQGKISPAELPLRPDGPYSQALHRSVEAERQLRGGLDPWQRELLKTISDAEIEMLNIAQTEAFAYGFRLGTQLLLAGLSKNKKEF